MRSKAKAMSWDLSPQSTTQDCTSGRGMAVAHSHAQPLPPPCTSISTSPSPSPPWSPADQSRPSSKDTRRTDSGWRQNGQWQRQRRTPSIDTGWRSTAFSTREWPKGDAACGLKNVGGLGAGGPLGEPSRPAPGTSPSGSLGEGLGAPGCSGRLCRRRLAGGRGRRRATHAPPCVECLLAPPPSTSHVPAHPAFPCRERYYDDVYEYRHVVLPQDIAKRLPKDKLLSEAEWRALGVQQSRGWGE